MTNNIKIYFRASSQGNPLGRMELKGTGLEIATRKKFLVNFINVFGLENLHMVADNCNEETISYFKEKNIKDIEMTHFGNTQSFKHIVYRAINESDSDDQIIYLCEDDYVHAPNAGRYLEEGLDVGQYVSLYDSLDKYLNSSTGGNNPLIYEGGEDTKVILGKSIHFKRTNSTTCTFAARVKTLKEDLPVIEHFCPDDAPHPMDFLMFRYLIEQRNRILICPIPGKASHWGLELSPFSVDWISLIKDIKE